MNRRDFLATTGVAVGAAAAAHAIGASPLATAPRRSPRQIKKAVMYGMIGEGSNVLEKFKAIKDTGFEGVEMDSPSTISPEEILKARDATGIQVHGVVDSVHWKLTLSNPEPEVRRQGLAALETAIRDCAGFGGVSVLLVPAVVNKDVSYADAWTRSQAEIKKALPLAEQLGVKIAIENVWNGFLLSPLEAARYVDELASPAAAFHFDVGNVINFGWPEQWVRILGKRTVKLHIKEFSRKKRDAEGLWKGFEVELLEGDNDWPAVMKALDEVGYAGWATAEVGGGDAARLRAVSQKMDKILAL